MERPSFIFSSDKLELKSEGENLFVEGYISTSDLDVVNDIVTKACLMDMADQMKERVIKFDVEHESFRGKSTLEREINKTTIPVAKVEDFLMDKKGLKVRAKLNRHANRFDEVKGSIEDGFLDAFSIAYIPTKVATQTKDGQDIRLLDKINLLNVAFTGNPVNTSARMTNVFAKSLEFLEEEKAKAPKRPKPKIPESEYEDDEEDEDKKKKKKKEGKNHNHISDTIKLQEAKMSEEEEKKPVEGEESEESKPEESGTDEAETEQKDESKEESEESDEESEEENAEVKALREEVKSLKKDFAELKSKIKAPVRKSPMEQKDKSEQFEEGKSLNPLDVIA